MTDFASIFHLRPSDVRDLTIFEFDRFAYAIEGKPKNGER